MPLKSSVIQFLKMIYIGYANSKRISNDMFLESLSMLHGSSSHFNDYEDPIYLWRRWKFKLISHVTSGEKCVEIIKTLHVKFFLFGQKWPSRTVTVKIHSLWIITYLNIMAFQINLERAFIIFISCSPLWLKIFLFTAKIGLIYVRDSRIVS